MMRFLAISLGVIAFFSALTTYVVFSQRRSFPQNRQIVFEMGDQNHAVYGIQPTSGFGDRLHILFDPTYTFQDRYVTGVDCSPDSGSLIFWYIFLYRFNLADENLTQIVLGQGLSQQSVWSPDGKRIAYIDDIADRQPREIFVIDADGTNMRQITANDHKEPSLSWSPTGTEIAFTYSDPAQPSLAQQGLALVEVASGASTILYQGAKQVGDAAWSPDGTQIAFDMADEDRVDIYTIHPDGSNLTRLTREAADNIDPHWSPDGTLISYSARDTGGHYQLYVILSLIHISEPTRRT